VLLTTPLWVANTRIKTSMADGRATSLLATLRSVYSDEGIDGLWSGTVPSLILVTNPIIQFAAYDQLKRLILVGRGAAAKVCTVHHKFDYTSIVVDTFF
jgi:solute carrier family 25 (peroxisomal adenine nucleotide transporter), member 17